MHVFDVSIMPGKIFIEILKVTVCVILAGIFSVICDSIAHDMMLVPCFCRANDKVRLMGIDKDIGIETADGFHKIASDDYSASPE